MGERDISDVGMQIGQAMSRRGFARLLGGVSLASAAAMMVPGLIRRAAAASFAGTKLVFASWGGVYQDTQKVAFCEPFAKSSGATVIQDGPVDYAKYRVMVKSGAPTWDVTDIEAAFLFSGVTEGLFEKIDTSVVDVSRLDPKFVHEYGVGAIVWSYNLGFSLTAFPEGKQPQSWTDMFDLEKFPGKRMMIDSVAPMLEVALLADGVTPDALYPLDADRAFRKLDTIKKDLLLWTTNSQSQQLLVDGEAVMGVINNSRIFDAVKKGAELGIAWNQALQSVDYLVVAKGSRNIPASMALINEMTTVAAQASVANALATSPTNPAAFPEIQAEVRPWLSTYPEHAPKGVLVNEAYWKDNLRPLTDRWAQWKLS